MGLTKEQEKTWLQNDYDKAKYHLDNGIGNQWFWDWRAKFDQGQIDQIDHHIAWNQFQQRRVRTRKKHN